jgi:two-component system, chemotaxis family, sensor kinase CheA
MNDARSKLLAMFREETEERLDRIVEGLLAIETGSAPDDTISALFRDAHSIKGSAGIMGFDEAYEIGHALEDVLARAREDGSLAQRLVEPLLLASDALRCAVAGDTGVAEPAVAALRAASKGSVEAGVSPRTSGNSPEPVDGRGGRRSLRVEAERVDRVLDAVSETVVHHRRIEHALRAPADGREHETSQDLVDRGDSLLDELQEAVIRLRTAPFSSITGPFARAVRDLAVGQGKQVEFVIEGAESQLDRGLLDGTSEAITHLLRNAVAHGIEPPDERARAGKPLVGRIELRAEQRGDRVAIEVRDDGRGVAPELLQASSGPHALASALARAGMSTATAVTDVAGRGVGLDAVKEHVEAANGSLEIHSEPGRGTTVSLLLPMYVALFDVLMLERGGIVFAVPITSVSEVTRVDEALSLLGRPAVDLGGEAVPVHDLIAVLGGSASPLPAGSPAVVLSRDGRRTALLCDRVLGEDAVVVKRLGSVLTDTSGYLGGAVMGDGRVALVLDPARVLSAATHGGAGVAHVKPEVAPPTVLVVDDQFTVRELQRSILEASGYRVETARDGREAWERLSSRSGVGLVVTDLEMPEMDGFELLSAIRRHAPIASLPVVIVTSRAAEGDERRGLDAGADAYIVKERFDQRALLDTVERLVGR